MTKQKENNKRKILIISQYFPPDISGGGTRAYNYAMCLAKNFDVTVITAFPHLHNKVSNEYRWKITKKEQMANFSVIRVRVPSLLHSSTRNRILLHFSFLTNSLIPLWSIKPEIIFASEPNLLSIIPAYFYSKLRGGKVIRVVDDLWPEVLYERNIVKNKFFKIFLNRLAKFSYTFPSIILPLTEEAAQHIISLYKISKEKIIVIQHGVNTEIFKPSPKNNQNEFIIMYSGALVESYDFDIIFEAAKILKNENIKFIIRGKGILQDYLVTRKNQFNLEKVIIDEEIVSEQKLIKKLNEADVFVVPMKNDKFLNMSLPTKILEYQALGKPIICCSDGAPGNYVKKTDTGIKVKSGNIKELVDAIIYLQNNEEIRNHFGRNGKEIVDEKLTFDKIGKRLSSLIQTLIRT